MKKLITTLTIFATILVGMAATRLWVYQNDGTRTPFDFTTVDSISLAEPGSLVLTPATKTLPYTGGRFTVTVQANKPWTATVDDPLSLTISKSSGMGNGTITCVAVANGDEMPYTATLTVELEDGTSVDLPITVEALELEPASLVLSPTSKQVAASGERFTVTVTSNKAWSVSCDQPWVTLSTTSGTGNGSFVAVVAANESTTADNATITVTTATGNVVQTVGIERSGKSGFDGLLTGAGYIVYYMNDQIYSSISDRVLLDFRPNDEYIFMYDWAGGSYGTPTEPDPFNGGYDYMSLRVGSAGWSGVGLCVTDNYGYTNEGNAMMDSYESLVKGHESEWTLVVVMRSDSENPEPWIQYYGFSGTPYDYHLSNLPSSDGFWHVYTMRLDEWGEYSKQEVINSNNNLIAFGGSIDACAAFLVRGLYNLDEISYEINGAILVVNPEMSTVNSSGGTVKISVRTNTLWSVSCDQPWVTLSTTSGTGNGSFSVLVAANESNMADIATITVTGNVTRSIAISRAAISGSMSGHDYVDLGLPSGTLWATCNVGAYSPEEYGDYFAWGETSPKTNYCWSTYKYGTSSSTLTKYCSNSSFGLNGYTDTKTVLDSEDDAATANWGSGWRMPTYDEICELCTECTSVWTTQGGKNGRLFTGPNGNMVFLPAAGCYYGLSPAYGSSLGHADTCGNYWSSSPNVCYPYYLDFNSYYANWATNDSGIRCGGRSVRPIVNTAYLSLDVYERSILGFGGSFTVTVNSNEAWSASCDQSWVTLSTTSGTGNGSFQVIVAANESEMPDQATITVTCMNITKQVIIQRSVTPVDSPFADMSGVELYEADAEFSILRATASWGGWNFSTDNVQASINGDDATIEVLSNTRGNKWYCQTFINTGLSVAAGKSVLVSFDISCNAAEAIETGMSIGDWDYDWNGGVGIDVSPHAFSLDKFYVTSTPRHVELGAKNVATAINTLRITLGLGGGGENTVFTISNMKVELSR